MIEELKDLHPAVACTYIIVGGAIIVTAIYNWFRWLRGV
jgi:hypothetical protein